MPVLTLNHTNVIVFTPPNSPPIRIMLGHSPSTRARIVIDTPRDVIVHREERDKAAAETATEKS